MQKVLFDYDDNDKQIPMFCKKTSYNQIKRSGMADIQREKVKQIICEHPEGITDLEICITCGISRSSVTARRNEIGGVFAIGIAKIVDEFEDDRLNTLWGFLSR